MPILKETVQSTAVPEPILEANSLKPFPQLTNETLWIILLIAVVYFFKDTFLSIAAFSAKLGLVAVFLYFTFNFL